MSKVSVITLKKNVNRNFTHCQCFLCVGTANEMLDKSEKSENFLKKLSVNTVVLMKQHSIMNIKGLVPYFEFHTETSRSKHSAI